MRHRDKVKALDLLVDTSEATLEALKEAARLLSVAAGYHLSAQDELHARASEHIGEAE